MESHDLDLLNAMFKTNHDLKVYLEHHEKIILPSTKSKAVTTAYLLKAARKEVFTLPLAKYQHYRYPLKMALTTQKMLDKMSRKTQDKPLGFEIDRPPDREWAIDCLYSL